jgi:hypothetical protein
VNEAVDHVRLETEGTGPAAPSQDHARIGIDKYAVAVEQHDLAFENGDATDPRRFH